MGSKRKGSARSFLELNGKRPPSNPNSFPVRLGRSHVPSVVEYWAPQIFFSPFRRHPFGVKTWDLLRFSTYQQHLNPVVKRPVRF